MTKLILGSASPRRAQILTALGVEFETLVPQVEEIEDHGTPRATVRENALRKLAWCMAATSSRPVLCADTVVEFMGRPVGKPISMDDAIRMLLQSSGAEQQVFTSVAYCAPNGMMEVHVVESRVWFKNLDRDAIAGYFNHVNPLDKAGAYDIGQARDLIIARWAGSYTNIMGLPAELVGDMLLRDGFRVRQYGPMAQF